MEKYLEILSKPNRPKIGVVVSSGGTKSFAALEVFDYLGKAGIPIDLLAGTSGGSVISAFRSLGFSTEEMKDFIYRLVTPEMFRVNYRTLAALLKMPFFDYKKDEGILRNDVLLNTFLNEFGPDTTFADTKIPLIAQATNIDTGEGVVMTSGNLAKSIYASAALLPFFPPVMINGAWLADGGFSCSLPILPVVNAGMDIIIAIDVQPKSSYMIRSAHQQSFLEHFDNFLMKTLSNTTSFQNLLAIDTHHHEIILMEIPFEEGVEMWETKKIPMVFDKGRQAVEKYKNQIIEAIETFIVKP